MVTPKDPTPSPKKPKKNRKGRPVMVWFPDPIKKAMTELADKNDRPLTREIDRAIRAWLTQHGCLPEGE